MTENKKKAGISGSTLKIIALVSMFIDHMAVSLIEVNYGNKDSFLYNLPWSENTILQVDVVLREIGRLAFPIFCFLLVQGAMYTHDRKRYLCNMAVFALLSEIPFDLAFHNTLWYGNSQNVFFTLTLGLISIYLLDWWKGKEWISFGMVAVVAALAYFLRTDYGASGVILIVFFWLFRFEEKLRNILCSVWMIVGISLSEAAGIFAFLPIHAYNGERGKQLKYFFYFFYPVHLLVLFGVRVFLG